MTDEVFSIRAARARWSEIVARAERGERIVIARAGLPVAEIGPLQDSSRRTLTADDPLLNLDQFSVDGPGGDLANDDIDRILYRDT
jgi:prevent-host-death family protein